MKGFSDVHIPLVLRPRPLPVCTLCSVLMPRIIFFFRVGKMFFEKISRIKLFLLFIFRRGEMWKTCYKKKYFHDGECPRWCRCTSSAAYGKNILIATNLFEEMFRWNRFRSVFVAFHSRNDFWRIRRGEKREKELFFVVPLRGKFVGSEKERVSELDIY